MLLSCPTSASVTHTLVRLLTLDPEEEGAPTFSLNMTDQFSEGQASSGRQTGYM